MSAVKIIVLLIVVGGVTWFFIANLKNGISKKIQKILV